MREHWLRVQTGEGGGGEACAFRRGQQQGSTANGLAAVGKAVAEQKAAVAKPLHPQLKLERYGWGGTDDNC